MKSNIQVAHSRWSSRKPCETSYDLAVGCDLLDVDRRRELVDDKMMGIDDLNAFSRHEPQFAVGGLRDGRTEVGGRNRMEPDAVGRIPHGRFNPALRVGDPRVQFAARDAHEAAGRVQPERTVVVLYRPVNRVAGQTVSAL